MHILVVEDDRAVSHSIELMLGGVDGLKRAASLA